jgi:hypothetical protein
MKKIMCLYQLFRPKPHYPHLEAPKVPGKGNCRICSPDVLNIYCSGYYPIVVIKLDVKDEDPNQETISAKVIPGGGK